MRLAAIVDACTRGERLIYIPTAIALALIRPIAQTAPGSTLLPEQQFTISSLIWLLVSTHSLIYLVLKFAPGMAISTAARELLKQASRDLGPRQYPLGVLLIPGALLSQNWPVLINPIPNPLLALFLLEILGLGILLNRHRLVGTVHRLRFGRIDTTLSRGELIDRLFATPSLLEAGFSPRERETTISVDGYELDVHVRGVDATGTEVLVMVEPHLTDRRAKEYCSTLQSLYPDDFRLVVATANVSPSVRSRFASSEVDLIELGYSSRDSAGSDPSSAEE